MKIWTSAVCVHMKIANTMNGRMPSQIKTCAMHSQIETGAICTSQLVLTGQMWKFQQPSQLQDLTGQGLYQTDSLVRNHGAIPGGSGFMPLALPVPQSLPCLPHNMSGVEASHFMTFLWLHACWKPE